MIERRVNPRKQGDAGMGMAIAFFATQGHTVCLPLTDSQPYDLVVDWFGELKRVSVKTTTAVNAQGNYVVGLRTQGGNKTQHIVREFDNTTCDLLYIATEAGDEYLIPTEDLTVKATITLADKYKQYLRV